MEEYDDRDDDVPLAQTQPGLRSLLQPKAAPSAPRSIGEMEESSDKFDEDSTAYTARRTKEALDSAGSYRDEDQATEEDLDAAVDDEDDTLQDVATITRSVSASWLCC